jgi:hypothetical protein
MRPVLQVIHSPVAKQVAHFGEHFFSQKGELGNVSNPAIALHSFRVRQVPLFKR